MLNLKVLYLEMVLHVLEKKKKIFHKMTIHYLFGKFIKKWLPSYHYSGGTSQLDLLGYQ